MPCYRCGARQVDPVRGHSPWRRGVRADEQVLICPDCQAGTEWMAELDRCRRCGSVHLVRRLGEVECRDCGMMNGQAEPPADSGGRSGAAASKLAEDVERALGKVFGRSAVSG